MNLSLGFAAEGEWIVAVLIDRDKPAGDRERIVGSMARIITDARPDIYEQWRLMIANVFKDDIEAMTGKKIRVELKHEPGMN